MSQRHSAVLGMTESRLEVYHYFFLARWRLRQIRPVSMCEEQLQRLDGFLFHHVKASVVPRFLCLTKSDLRTCITGFVPAKVGGLPPDVTQQQVVHLTSALIDDYYKYVSGVTQPGPQ